MRLQRRKKDNFYPAMVVSLLLHLLILVAYVPVRGVLALKPVAPQTSLPAGEEKRLEFELVETPEDAASDQLPDKTNLLSDKTSIARDEYTGSDKPLGNPYSEGQTDYKIFAGTATPPSPLPADGEQGEEDLKKMQGALNADQTTAIERQQITSDKKFSRSALLGVTQSSSHAASGTGSDDINYRNLKFSARDLGGVTLNTYAWDFAPYIFEMKNKLRQNIYPPAAFTRLGLINGQTVLRFKVLRSGEMRDLAMLGHTGHPSLRETSVNAVKNSSPFKPLPADFPEEFLELTWTFIYSTNLY